MIIFWGLVHISTRKEEEKQQDCKWLFYRIFIWDYVVFDAPSGEENVLMLHD